MSSLGVAERSWGHAFKEEDETKRQIDLYQSKQIFYIGVNLKGQRTGGKGVRNLEVRLTKKENSKQWGNQKVFKAKDV